MNIVEGASCYSHNYREHLYRQLGYNRADLENFGSGEDSRGCIIIDVSRINTYNDICTVAHVLIVSHEDTVLRGGTR